MSKMGPDAGGSSSNGFSSPQPQFKTMSFHRGRDGSLSA